MRCHHVILASSVVLLLSAYTSFAQDWGMYRYVHSKTNIRAGRSTMSPIVGSLDAGQKVKADFISDNWLAVFPVNERTRDERRALGYVYAPLLMPAPLRTSGNSGKSGNGLEYHVVAREDVSYIRTPRMVYRIILDVKAVPSEASMREVANRIWKNGNTGWKEFTIFMYLPTMDTSSLAYGIAEYRPHGLKEFSVSKWALFDTKWE